MTTIISLQTKTINSDTPGILKRTGYEYLIKRQLCTLLCDLQVRLFTYFLSFIKAPLPQELGGTLKGFIVQYKEQISGVSGFTEVSLPASARQYTLQNMRVFALYGIRVAAVNEKGPGPYTPVYNVTTGEKRKSILCISTIVVARCYLESTMRTIHP